MKIVVILSRFPYPLEKGDKLRAFQHLKQLHAMGHELHLVALSDQPVADTSYQTVKALCQTIHIIKLSYFTIFMNVVGSFIHKLPIQVGYFYSPGIRKKINRIINKINPKLIYCQLIRTALFAKDHPGIPAVLDYMDAFSKGTRQRAEKAPWWIKPLFNREIKMVEHFESNCYIWFKSHLIISLQDREALQVPLNKQVYVVPNGVDTDFFFPQPSDKKVDITFVGNMNYPPNVDGATFLVEDIMPGVWQKYPEVTVQIAGANPSKKVKSLASELVFVTGWVDDIRKCYRSAKIFVAPMRIGTGLQNKLLEAMAMGIPCITTPLSFEPLGAVEGKQILVGEKHSELAENILKLVADEKLRNQIGSESVTFVKANYSLEHSAKLLSKAIQNALAK